MRPLILIVDDDPVSLALMEEFLGDGDWEVWCVESAEAALVFLETRMPDLLLLDAMLPGMNGTDLAAIFRGRPDTALTPILMITASRDPALRSRGLRAGVVDFLRKPIHREDLRVRVANHLRTKSLADALSERNAQLHRQLEERAWAEAALRQSEARSRALFHQAHDAMFVVGMDGRLLDVNAVACQVLEYDQTELLELTIYDVVVPAEGAALAKSIRSLPETGPVTLAGRHVSRTGQEIPVEAHLGLVRLGKQEYVMVSARDMTQRENLEEQVRQATKLEAIGRLAGGVAHDFNNLLTVILTHAQLAAETAPVGSEQAQDLARVMEAGRSAAALTHQLLTISRQHVFAPRVVLLNQVIDDIHRLLKRTIGEDIQFTLLLEPRLWRVRADPERLRQVVMNLCVNARDAMPEGGRLLISTRNETMGPMRSLALPLMKDGEWVALTIADTGSGIGADVLPHIFEPFYTTKAAGGGTGLGLASVYGIVKLFDGEITVESELGQGTSFTVWLPRTTQEFEELKKVSRNRATRTATGTETILLVEDDTIVRQLAVRILRRPGYQVLEARSPVEALVMAERHVGRIDLLLTDVVMPQLSGGELARRVRIARPDIQVLYMSGYSDDEIVARGVRSGDAHLLLKPFTPSELLSRVVSVLYDDPSSQEPEL
jgi:PAS domain S-box-containing protein